MAIVLDKKSKPCYPIILHFKMDPEPESLLIFSALLNGAGAVDGQSDISTPSLVTYSIYTNTFGRAHTHTKSCTDMQLCTCMLLRCSHIKTHTDAR